MPNPKDLRSFKTEQKIKEVFLLLIDEIGFQNITIRILVERAQINRSTFYLHYTDKYDLLRKVEDELFDNIRKLICEVPTESISLNNAAFVNGTYKAAEYIYENRQTFSLLMGENGDPYFMKRYTEVMRSVWFSEEIVNSLSISPHYAFAALTGIVTNSLSEWVRTGFRESPEEYAQIVSKIIGNMPQRLFSQK